MYRVIPDERDTADQREANRNENPVNQLTPMHALNLVKAPVFKKLPRAKNIDLVSPDRADVVKRQSKVQEEENGAMVTHPEDDTLPTPFR
jgi:hypothetical protein